jgi:hypothetical protein
MPVSVHVTTLFPPMPGARQVSITTESVTKTEEVKCRCLETGRGCADCLNQRPLPKQVLAEQENEERKMDQLIVVGVVAMMTLYVCLIAHYLKNV